MQESVFTRAYSYRERENHSSLENYLIEIFAWCLEYDELFRNDFLLSLNLKLPTKSQKFVINTQSDYIEFGRPDIEINYAETCIFIECKVEASENEGQLKKYKDIFSQYKNQYPNQHLVFLTKYFEHRDDLNLKYKRWYEIYELIGPHHNLLTQNLKQFLNDYNMESVKNFTIQDMQAMLTITETITKMDEVMEYFKPWINKQFGVTLQDSSRRNSLSKEGYYNYITLADRKMTYYLLIGFYWWYELEIPYIGITIDFPTKLFEGSDLKNFLDQELLKNEDWAFEDGHRSEYNAVKPIIDFLTDKNEPLLEMRKFLERNLNYLIDLKIKNKNFLKY